jgi:hypothetical protein
MKMGREEEEQRDREDVSKDSQIGKEEGTELST